MAERDEPRRRRPRDEDEGIEPVRPRRPAVPRGADDEDELPRRRRRPRDEDDYDDDYEDRPRRKRSGIIPRNGMALAAYYCGMGGLIIILGSVALAIIVGNRQNAPYIALLMFAGGGLLALLAVLFGIIGMVKASNNPEGGGTTHSIIGMALGILEILGLLLVLMLGIVAR